ncbi:MAG TPA: YggT family protein [Steroidobacteraceae bacterium]|jgi:YggT family protein|nr:YggT family protein [Steroidobacteraceae bacterium]
MEAVLFLVDSVLAIVVFAFLLRVLLQLVRADFRNPLAQAVLALTNWLVLPLRRLLPPAGRFDTASFVALLAVQLVATLVLFRLRTGVVYPFVPLLLASLRQLANATLVLYTILIFAQAILSFFPGARSPVTALLHSLCEPVLRPFRRILPIVGGLDFSPLVAILLLTALRIMLR